MNDSEYSTELPLATMRKKKVPLESIPLNDLDVLMAKQLEETYDRKESKAPPGFDGLCTSLVNTSTGGWLHVDTRGKEEFVSFNVFVGKIHHESNGLDDVSQYVQRQAWCDMAEAFVDKFGEDRTPHDIISCRRSIRKVFGI